MRINKGIAMLTAAVTALVATTVANAVSVVGSPHDLNTLTGVSIPGQQVCLPCHAPHNTTMSEHLWNHSPSTNTYQLYYSKHSTRYSSTSAAELDQVSKMCLSCHDGAIAVDSYNGHTGSRQMGEISAGSVIGGGGDLTNDHPVGVRYPGYKTDGTWSGSGYNDPRLFSSDRKGPDGSSALGGAAVKLYKLESEGSGDASTIVGCGTCHTPHSYDYRFLRIKNDYSTLCLKCHVK